MQSSTFYQRLYTCLLVMILCAAAVVAAPPSYSPNSLKMLLDKRQPNTDCYKREIGLICHQCGLAHREHYLVTYEACCRGQSIADIGVRMYCNDRYTEPPKRGGWQG